MRTVLSYFPILFLKVCLAVGGLQADETYTRLQDGFEVLGISNGYWTVEVVPGLGGKLITLQDHTTGREWLWSRMEERRLFDDDRFGYGNLIGADELLPNLKVETWDGAELRGHGELWSSETIWSQEALREGVIQTSYALETLPIEYTRTVRLKGKEILIEITVENVSNEAFPYLWAWHPLFSIEPGDEFGIQLPPEIFDVITAPGIPQIKAGDTLTWPGADSGIGLTELSLGEAPKAGIKLYSKAPVDGVLTLANAESGAGLSIVFDTDALPYMAIWLSRGIWGGAHHLAIEATNQPDEFIEAEPRAANPQAWLAAGETRQWWLRIVNDSKPPAP